MVLKRNKKTNKAAPAAAVAGATGAAGLVGYALRRRRRGREAEPPASGEAVMPDTSSDPLVDEQTDAAAAEAGSIGGNVDDMPTSDASFPEDPAAMRPVDEGSGDSEESFETGTEEVGR